MINITTRAEHVKWCKERAIQEFEFYKREEGIKEAITNGLTSMASDLGKHPETTGTLQSLCIMMMASIKSEYEFRKFINGFNE